MADDFTFMTRVLLWLLLGGAVVLSAVLTWWRAAVRLIKRRTKR